MQKSFFSSPYPQKKRPIGQEHEGLHDNREQLAIKLCWLKKG